jgi:hypothetical protein
MAEAELIEKASQFEDTPEGKAALWTVEMAAADKELKPWWTRADEIIRVYLDQRRGGEGNNASQDTRVNLFTSNVQTMRSLLYGQTPRSDVKRRFNDPADDIARVGGEMLQRLLNSDIERDSDNYAASLFHALDDWLLPGLGNVRLVYEAEFDTDEGKPAILHPETGEELAPAVPPQEFKSNEEVEVEYLHWRDQRWSPCRFFGEVRWWAFKADMTRDALHKRFGGEGGLSEAEIEAIPLNSKETAGDAFDAQKNNPWQRAEVWEIWSKDDKKVYWWVKGSPKILDAKDDPLGLDGFWPFPEPLLANGTSSKLIPTPDYSLAQDLYIEINDISTRITKLEQAVVARGVYDKTSAELGRLLSEAKTNDMIPVENWAMFAEKGGLKGVVDWLPLDQVVGALDKLREYRQELIALSYQVTGMSDIMRGQSSGQTTATEQAIKAKFAGVRMQFRQQEFARFASDLLSLKAEIIAKHFDPQTIIDRSNVQYMAGVDQTVAMQAVQMIKDDIYQYRVEVKPEAISMADYAAVKEERSAMLTAVATFLQSSMPVMQAAPMMTPMLLQLLQWALAGFRGGSTIEGVIDQTVVKIQQDMEQKAKQPPPPNPDMIKAEMDMKAKQQEMQIKQMSAQMDMVMKKMDLDFKKQEAQIDLGVKQQTAQIDLQKSVLGAQVDQQKAEGDLAMQERQMQADARKGSMDEKMAMDKHALNMEMQKARAEAVGKEPKNGKN